MLNEEETLSLQSEFGEGQLFQRLKRAELRISGDGYSVKDWHDIVKELAVGLDLNDQIVTEIVDQVEKAWQDEEKFVRALQPWKKSNEAGLTREGRLSFLSVGRDTFARTLLHVEALQPGIVRCLVQKIPEFSELGGIGPDTSKGEMDIARKTLKQLKWMDFVVDGAALCEVMLSVVSVCPPDLQRDIIAALPGAIDDSSRDQAVDELLLIIQSSPNLMASVLDALNALGIAPGRLEHVNKTVLNTLAAVDQDTLPTTLRYLLRATPSHSLEKTVDAVRESLALGSVGPDAGRLCLDALRMAIRQRKDLADAILKKLKYMSSSKNSKPADIWLILALMDSPAFRRSTESIFKRKASDQVLKPWLFEAAIKPFAEGLVEVSSHMIALASMLLKSSETHACHLSTNMFRIVFQSFDDLSVRRNVVDVLLEHSGSKSDAEIDAALHALLQIAIKTEKSGALAHFSAAIQTLFDFLETFSDSQLRKIWSIFGMLCRSCIEEGKDEDQSDLSMLDIIIRKELTHTSDIYRRIGIIGACTVVGILGTSNNSILPLLFESVKQRSWSQALAYDELARTFSRSKASTVSGGVIDSVLSQVRQDFEVRFTCDIAESPSKKKCADDETELRMSLEGDEADIYIPITQYVKGYDSKNPDALQAMVPNFRLLCILEAYKNKGDLGEIDALLGCPLSLPKWGYIKKLESLPSVEQCHALLVIFNAFNWIIELVNAFCEQKDEELRGKCIERLNNIVELADLLSRCVAVIPTWFNDLYDANYFKPVAEKVEVSQNISPATTSKGKKSGTTKLRTWRTLARRLSLDALSLIHVVRPIEIPEIVRIGADGVSEVTEVTLEPRSLHFMLEQLASHTAFLSTMCRKLKRSSRTRSTVEFHCYSLEFAELVDAEGPISAMLRLKSCLLAVGKQMRRCLVNLQIIDSAKHDDVDDDPQNIEDWQDCAALCLRCYADVIPLCSDQLDSSVRSFLFDILKSIDITGKAASVQKSDPVAEQDITSIAKAVFEQLRQSIGSSFTSGAQKNTQDGDDSEEPLLTFESYGLYLNVLHAITKCVQPMERERLSTKVSDSAGSLLEREWHDLASKQPRAAPLLSNALSTHISTASDSVECMSHITEMLTLFDRKRKAVESSGSEDGGCDNNVRTWGTISSSTVHIFKKSLLQECSRMLRSFDGEQFSDVSNALQHVKDLVMLTQRQYLLARSDTKVLSSAMREGRTIVESFTKRLMPYFKANFRSERDQILDILKVQQKTTRLLQTFCSHGKAVRNSALTSIVPSLRKSLELFLYRVKEMMQARGAIGAFCLGNLKHRDIAGQVVPSQIQEVDDSSEYSDEEKINTIAVEDKGAKDTGREAPSEPVLQDKRNLVEGANIVKHVASSNQKSKKRKRLQALSSNSRLSKGKKQDTSHRDHAPKRVRSAQTRASSKLGGPKRQGRYKRLALVDTEAVETAESVEEDSYETDLDGFIVDDEDEESNESEASSYANE